MKTLKFISFLCCFLLFYASCKKDSKSFTNSSATAKPVGIDTFKTLSGTWVNDSPKSTISKEYHTSEPYYQIILNADSTYSVMDTSLVYALDESVNEDEYNVYGIKTETGKWKITGKSLILIKKKINTIVIPLSFNVTGLDTVGRYDTFPIGNCLIDSISADYFSITTLKGQWTIVCCDLNGNFYPFSTPLKYSFKKE